MRQVIVPPAPGLFSAIGLLEAQTEHHFVQTYFGRTAEITSAQLDHTYAELEDRARATLTAEGSPAERIRFTRLADLRYAGQAYELTVPVPGGRIGKDGLAELAEQFEQEHERTYGHRARSEPVEVVNLRLRAWVADSGLPPLRPLTSGNHAAPAVRPAYFGPAHGVVPTLVLDRAGLDRSPRPGPCIVEEYDATTVVPPGCLAWLDKWGNIVIEIREHD